MLRSVLTVPRTFVRAFSASTPVAVEAPTKKEVDDLFAEKPQTKKFNSYSKNHVEIVGGVALDPLSKKAQNNNPFTILNVITNRAYKNAQGERVDSADRHVISFFGKQAEYVAQNFKKGDRVMVEATLRYAGGKLGENGERTPRITHIHGISIHSIDNRKERS